MAGATISYHLGILKKADLVLESREKNFIYYELNTSVLEENHALDFRAQRRHF